MVSSVRPSNVQAERHSSMRCGLTFCYQYTKSSLPNLSRHPAYQRAVCPELITKHSWHFGLPLGDRPRYRKVLVGSLRPEHPACDVSGQVPLCNRCVDSQDCTFRVSQSEIACRSRHRFGASRRRAEPAGKAQYRPLHRAVRLNSMVDAPSRRRGVAEATAGVLRAGSREDGRRRCRGCRLVKNISRCRLDRSPPPPVDLLGGRAVHPLRHPGRQPRLPDSRQGR